MPMQARIERARVAAVLAGGRGRRLGGAKANADLGGRPLLCHAIAAVEAAGLEPLVVAKPETELPESGCRVVREPREPRHPLVGIVAALRQEPALVVLAADMPFASPPLLARLAELPDELAVPAPGGELEPLQARYAAGALPALEAAIVRREPLRRTIESLGPRRLDDAELATLCDPARAFLNVNTPEDLARAEFLL
jgi:molybdopterin-guanine dinucleotide biosynthesis protein A